MSKPLRRPEFGDMPAEREGTAPRQVKPFKYRHLVEAVRAHPNATAKVAEFVGPTIYATNRDANRDWRSLRRWLDRHHPDEMWNIWIRRTPGTWAQRDIWIRYRGNDPEAAEADRQRRRDRMSNLKEKAIANRAAKEANARRLAIRANDENRRMNAGQR